MVNGTCQKEKHSIIRCFLKENIFQVTTDKDIYIYMNINEVLRNLIKKHETFGRAMETITKGNRMRGSQLLAETQRVLILAWFVWPAIRNHMSASGSRLGEIAPSVAFITLPSPTQRLCQEGFTFTTADSTHGTTTLLQPTHYRHFSENFYASTPSRVSVTRGRDKKKT